MSPVRLSYALVTAARDEEDNLPRLAECVAEQSIEPSAWIIVDTGSSDATPRVAGEIEVELPFVRTLAIEDAALPTRGGPIVRAFLAGLQVLERAPDVVVKLDADLSFASDYFERLLDAFAADPRLGIASGICTEFQQGAWRPLFGTRSHVWGASRAYRWACLQDVLPLEERQGWDEIDSIKAQVGGWHARTLPDAPFRHHRTMGARELSSRSRWAAQGTTAHYMGYRFSYLVARALWRARRDPTALAMVGGYAAAVARRESRCPDSAVRAHLRAEQRARRLPLRLRESLGHII
jgi:hypothetical protein